MDVKERIKIASVHMFSLFLSPSGACHIQLARAKMVGRAGLEPATPRLSSVCSNQLSYRPKNL